jgi:DNA-binding MarR family transcriptional regulator
MNTINLPTYQAIVLESRAHRVMKATLAAALREHGVTMMQWSIIGFIADAGTHGARISDIARHLDTSLAFVTTTVNVLQQKGLVMRTEHAHDSRAKIVRLSPDFAKKTPAIEASLKKELNNEVFGGIASDALDGYFSVVQHIARQNAA